MTDIITTTDYVLELEPDTGELKPLDANKPNAWQDPRYIRPETLNMCVWFVAQIDTQRIMYDIEVNAAVNRA